MSLSERDQTRRSFLKTTSALAVGGGAFFRSAFSAGKQIPIGVQLYCVRKELAENFDETMAAVAEIGFDGVEYADYFGRSARELRKSLDDNGLKCCGNHIVLPDMLGDKLKETVEFNQTLGNPYLIVRSLGKSLWSSPEEFNKTIGLFNEVAENLRPQGLRVGYHNHDYIFGKFDGKFLWDILADGTSKDVILQLDTGNAMVQSGVDVVALLKRHPGRTGTIHIKPYSSKKPDAYLGEDELDWPTIIKLCQTSAGTEWYIVEYEVEGIPPLKALKDNYLLFKKLVA